MSIGMVTRGIIGGVKQLVPVPVEGVPLVVTAVTVVSPTRLRLTLNAAPVVLNAAGFAITRQDGPGVAVLSVAVELPNSIVVDTEDPQGGATYTLTISSGAVAGADGGPLVTSSRAISYVGARNPPNIVNVASEDPTHILVTFSEALQQAGMLTLANYQVTPPFLRIISVALVSPTQVRLTTGLQQPGVRYALAVSNVRDLAGNPIETSTRAI